MNVTHITFNNGPGTGRSWSWIARLLLLFAIFLLASTAVFAAPGKGYGHKLAPDMANFPLNPDGTVDVIIQFKDTPEAEHFQMMANRGGRLKFNFTHIKGAAFRIPAKLLAFLEAHNDIAYVTPDRPNTPTFDDAAPAVLADIARQQYALDGTGIGIAVIDSGVSSHDDLQKSSGAGSRIVYSESFVAGDPSTADGYGHGTHVAGIIAGNGRDSQSNYPEQYTGIAPNANIINLRVLSANGGGNDSQVIAAIQRAIQLKNTYNIRVINLSVGRQVFESYTLDPVCQAVEAAWKAGIVVVVAAGNTGRDNSYGTHGYATIQAPGNDPAVITVGATKTQGTLTRMDDAVASYSSKGPTLIDHVVKPDLVAPGNRIVSLLAPGSYLGTQFKDLQVNPTCALSITCTAAGGRYLRLSGTSMATPVVAAAAALMIQKDPTLTPDLVKARLMKTAWKSYVVRGSAVGPGGNLFITQHDVFAVGAGYLDVAAALNSNDLANGGAASPTATYSRLTHVATLSNGATLGGSSVIWGSSAIWGSSVVWGSNTIIADSIVWGSGSAVWGDLTDLTSSTTIWASSIVWGSGLIEPLSTGDDGEN